LLTTATVTNLATTSTHLSATPDAITAATAIIPITVTAILIIKAAMAIAMAETPIQMEEPLQGTEEEMEMAAHHRLRTMAATAMIRIPPQAELIIITIARILHQQLQEEVVHHLTLAEIVATTLPLSLEVEAVCPWHRSLIWLAKS
jgi:hypothetical protein